MLHERGIMARKGRLTKAGLNVQEPLVAFQVCEFSLDAFWGYIPEYLKNRLAWKVSQLDVISDAMSRQTVTTGK